MRWRLAAAVTAMLLTLSGSVNGVRQPTIERLPDSDLRPFTLPTSHPTPVAVSGSAEETGSVPSAAPFTASPDPSPRPTPGPTDSGPVQPGPRSTPTPARTAAPTWMPTPSGWINVINDQFNSGGVPGHWSLYDGPYGSGANNCATPSHASVSGGSMHMLLAYETGGDCGAGWYSAGMQIDARYGAVDQRVTVRFRVVSAGVTSHLIIPMRWPDSAPWPQGGEEDYCEGDRLSGCATYLHYGAGNNQIRHAYAFDMSRWHTVRFQRLNHVVRVYIDNMATPVWKYVGSSTALPNTIKRVVLQQECDGSCPSGTSGSEDIQIDWITIDNPR